jgi:hypothetical protein
MIDEEADHLQLVLTKHYVKDVSVETDIKRLDHATALTKGQKLLAIVRSTDGTAKQSPYVNPEALKTWGYENHVSSLRHGKYQHQVTRPRYPKPRRRLHHRSD